MPSLYVLAAEQVDLRGAWAGFWNAVTSNGDANGLKLAMFLFGLVVAAASIVKWVLTRNQPRNENDRLSPNSALWTAGLGFVIAVPNLILPPVLGFIDRVVNYGLGLIG